MLEWLRFWRHTKSPEPALRGAPATPRMKTYAAESGYLYHYFFLGVEESKTHLKYAFSISGDRKSWFVNCVAVELDSLHDWEREHGRTLIAGERYAIAKLTLFEAFDSRSSPNFLHLPIGAGRREVWGCLERIRAMPDA